VRREFGGQDVTGNLLREEPVVRFVAIERVNDPVAVSPRVRYGKVGSFPGGVGVTHDVKPVPAPPLTVAGRRQQPVNDLRKGIGRVVRQKGLRLFRRWWQSGEVERCPAEQRPFVSQE